MEGKNQYKISSCWKSVKWPKRELGNVKEMNSGGRREKTGSKKKKKNSRGFAWQGRYELFPTDKHLRLSAARSAQADDGEKDKETIDDLKTWQIKDDEARATKER